MREYALGHAHRPHACYTDRMKRPHRHHDVPIVITIPTTTSSVKPAVHGR